MFREITRLREVQDMKTRESLDQHDRIKGLEYDLEKTLVRIGETERIVESRSYDGRTKNTQLDDNEREIARIKDMN